MTYDVLDIAEYVVYFANTKECRINVLQLMKILLPGTVDQWKSLYGEIQDIWKCIHSGN